MDNIPRVAEAERWETTVHPGRAAGGKAFAVGSFCCQEADQGAIR